MNLTTASSLGTANTCSLLAALTPLDNPLFNAYTSKDGTPLGSVDSHSDRPAADRGMRFNSEAE